MNAQFPLQPSSDDTQIFCLVQSKFILSLQDLYINVLLCYVIVCAKLNITN